MPKTFSGNLRGAISGMFEAIWRLLNESEHGQDHKWKTYKTLLQALSMISKNDCTNQLKTN